jgi:integrase
VIARSVFRAAVKDRLIATDPAQDVVLPRRRRTEAAMRIPTPAEVGRLLAHADSKRVSTRRGFRAYVAVCAFAGLRMGEAAGLQVGDIDFMKRTITVSRQLQRDGKSFAVRPPKYGSERVIHVPDDLLTILGQHIELYAMGEDADRWLFADDQGDPIYDNGVTWRWRATRVAANLTSVKLHDLRHFFASGLIAAGCDVVAVQKALGHASATTTLNTYAHLWPTAEDRTRKAASRLVREALADCVRTEDVV